MGFGLLPNCLLNLRQEMFFKIGLPEQVTSLPESNKDGIWIPWALMHTFGLLATAHCMISNFVSAEIDALCIHQISSVS